MTLPSVSILLPTMNERAFIGDCLDSLVRQDYPEVVEVIVIDGGSTDGTRAIVDAVGGSVRLLDNQRVTAAAALNIGLAEAKGDVIARADGHALYAPDYVRRCVEVLHETGADNVGGLMRPTATTAFGRAVAAVTSSPLGVGPGKFHYAHDRAEVDTVYLGCWRRETLESLGGWDEDNLQWGAEDHELNLRLRLRGGRIVLDPSIESRYFPRETPGALWRQYMNYGMGKASTLAKHAMLPTWRPVAPATLVLGSAVGFVAGRGWRRVALPAVHAGLAAAAARRLSSPDVRVRHAFAAMEICHWAYGLGFWRGAIRRLSGIPFDSLPQGHR